MDGIVLAPKPRALLPCRLPVCPRLRPSVLTEYYMVAVVG